MVPSHAFCLGNGEKASIRGLVGGWQLIYSSPHHPSLFLRSTTWGLDLSALASLLPTGGSPSQSTHNMSRAMVKVPVSTVGTLASISEEPLAEGGRKKSPFYCSCRSKKKTKFGAASSLKLMLPLAWATSQNSGSCGLFPFLGEAVAVFYAFDGSLIFEKSGFPGHQKTQTTGDCPLPRALTEKSPTSGTSFSARLSAAVMLKTFSAASIPSFCGFPALLSQAHKLPLLTLCPEHAPRFRQWTATVILALQCEELLLSP